MKKKRSGKKRNDWEYFDDCAVCQAMKRTDKAGEELPLPELLEAFRKANAAQADTFFAMDKKAQITKAGRKNKTHGNEDY